MEVYDGTYAPDAHRITTMAGEIERRREEQSALAELGQAALTGVDVSILLGQTCALVEHVLGSVHCSIVESLGNDEWRECFAIGTNSTFGSCDDASPQHRALIVYAIFARVPVIFDNLSAEPRFDGRHLLSSHGIEAGISIAIPGRQRFFGAITAYSARPRRFAGDEVEFLKAVSDVTGSAIEAVRTDDARRTAERQFAEGEHRFRALVENSSEGIALLDARGSFMYASPATKRVLGYTSAEVVDRNFTDFAHPDDVLPCQRRIHDLVLAEGNEITAEMRMRHSDGAWRWIEGRYKNLLFNPSVRGIVVNYRDVTERKSAEQQLERLAYRDSLTDLPNRFLFHDRVTHAIEHARRSGSGLSVVYVDLDRFKVVNDTLGHSAGDRLLQIVGTRLRESLRSDDTIARLGGDEFAILLPDVARPEDAGNIGRKLLATLRAPVHVDGHELYTTGSVGIAIFPGDGEDIDTLLKHADAALYRSKELGRNTFQLFATSMNARYHRRLEMEMSLHAAVEHQEFEVYYQPLCDRMTHQVRAFEALIRWNRPGHGIVGPSEFIRLAEETQLILPIGEWVLRDSCRQLKEWRDAGLPHFTIAVNISAVQIAQPAFIHTIHQIISESGLEPEDIELEITESAALQNLEWTLSVLDQLRTLGVRLAVDDFGTGQSSLAYLKRLPVHTVKIDREFLRDAGSSPSDAAILSSIIQLGHNLNLYVIAEGIETHADRAMLEDYECDGFQGYLFSQPMRAASVPGYLGAFRYPIESAA